jgi:spermidine synthase
LSYFYPTGPLGELFATFTGNHVKSNIGIIGLGTGSTGGYAQPGQAWTFYEIDPQIESTARNPRYFTFLRDCAPQSRVVLGDARISLGQQPNGIHDVIVVDAFTSDAIPVHLLTREALALYTSKLAPGGVIAFHISNRYVNLRPILSRLARDASLAAYLRMDRDITQIEAFEGKLPSTWVVMARSTADIEALTTIQIDRACVASIASGATVNTCAGRVATPDSKWLRFTADVTGLAWTDNYSNVLETLRIR